MCAYARGKPRLPECSALQISCISHQRTREQGKGASEGRPAADGSNRPAARVLRGTGDERPGRQEA